MRSFRELTEAKETVVFGFGRFNPPTTGHEKLIEKVASVSKGNPFFIYPSHTTGPKDPLPHAKKVAWMRKMFPKYKKNIIADRNAKTAIQIAEKLYKDGYKNLIMVAGSDRLKEFETLLNRYNDAPDKKGNQLFKFDSVKVVSAGERDPDAEGVSGMSASKMRAAAEKGDFDSFKTGIPSTLNDADKKKLYFDVRKNMGIREEREMGDDYDSLRDAYLTGKIWNVGESVEANGISGEVVRKGTNYLSFMTEDGKVHKAWLHEVKFNENEVWTKAQAGGQKRYKDSLGGEEPLKAAKSPLQKLKDFDKSRVAVGKPPIFTDRKPPKFIRMKKAGMMTIMNVPTDEIDKFEKKGYKIIEDLVGVKPMSGPTGQIFALKSEEIELDERNYAKEYANYQGTPEQIARRSSRNKARRAMGDKAVRGMDVGHKDNDPLNNDPSNLHNEDPSKNRREPRLREEGELHEMSWYLKVAAKIDSLIHPKGYKDMVKRYAKIVKEKSGKKEKEGGSIVIHSPHSLATRIALDAGVSPRSFSQYINKLVSKGVLPKELKAEYQKEETMHTFSDLVKQINEVKQDKEIDDKDGTQPAKYYAGDMAKSTKSKRDAHFKAKKSGPAPGDADAKTKPSTHTKKFKQMFGEVLPDDADQGDYIKDFEKSDAPQFKGKSKEKRKDMAIAAYLSKNESFLDNVSRMLSEDGHTDVASMKNKVQIAQKALMKMQGELTKLGDEDDLPTWWTNKVATAVSRLDDMSDYIDTQVEEVQLDEKIEGLVKKADKSGMPYSVLKKVYDRGMAAWKTGHRPGTTPQQWAMARVNSFTTKSSGTWGKADKDLAKQVEQIEESCTELNEWGEIEEEAEYQGRKVTLNKPFYTPDGPKKSAVYVTGPKGDPVIVRFGDPNMKIKVSDPARRKSFRARHDCENPGPKWKARYWSCKAW
jgi:hypothetical protein